MRHEFSLCGCFLSIQIWYVMDAMMSIKLMSLRYGDPNIDNGIGRVTLEIATLMVFKYINSYNLVLLLSASQSDTYTKYKPPSQPYTINRPRFKSKRDQTVWLFLFSGTSKVNLQMVQEKEECVVRIFNGRDQVCLESVMKQAGCVSLMERGWDVFFPVFFCFFANGNIIDQQQICWLKGRRLGTLQYWDAGIYYRIEDNGKQYRLNHVSILLMVR